MIPDGTPLGMNTASGEKSIWQHLNYDHFKIEVVALERASKEDPCDRKLHQIKEWHNPRICNDDYLVFYILKLSNEMLTISYFLLLSNL